MVWTIPTIIGGRGSFVHINDFISPLWNQSALALKGDDHESAWHSFDQNSL